MQNGLNYMPGGTKISTYFYCILGCILFFIIFFLVFKNIGSKKYSFCQNALFNFNYCEIKKKKKFPKTSDADFKHIKTKSEKELKK